MLTKKNDKCKKNEMKQIKIYLEVISDEVIIWKFETFQNCNKKERKREAKKEQ